MFKALKIKVTGEQTEIEQEKDFEFKDYERALGNIETFNNFPAIYNGQTAMIVTSLSNDDKSIPINDKASSYYQKFLDLEETDKINMNIPNIAELKTSYMRGLYIRGDCILVLKHSNKGGINA